MEIFQKLITAQGLINAQDGFFFLKRNRWTCSFIRHFRVKSWDCKKTGLSLVCSLFTFFSHNNDQLVWYYQSSNQSSALFLGSRKVHFENSYNESNWWVGIWKCGIWRGTTDLWQTSLSSMGVFYYAGSGQSTQWFVTKKHFWLKEFEFI